MTDEFSWMDALPAVKHGGVPAMDLRTNPRYRELVNAFRELTPKQRDFVRALPSHNFVAARAAKALKLSERTTYRWSCLPTVRRASELYKALASEAAGIDAETVILRIEALAAYCEELIDVLDREGNPTGRKRMRDVAGAREALKLLAQHVGALKNDDSAANTREGPALNIVINSPAPAAIDVTPRDKRVTVNLPHPDR